MDLRACLEAPHLPPPAGLAFVFHGWGKIQNPFG